MFGTTKLIYRCLILSIFFAEAIFIAGYAQDGNTGGNSSIHTSIRSAQIVSPLSTADSAWENKPTYPKNMGKTYIEMKVNTELYNREIRKWAIDFYYKFPNDYRNRKAVLIAVDARVQYWEDVKLGAEVSVHSKDRRAVPLLEEELNNWKQVYKEMRTDYLSSSEISIYDKNVFRAKELLRLLLGPRIWGVKLSPGFLLKQFEESIHAAKKLDATEVNYKNHIREVFLGVEAIFVARENYGWSLSDVQEFLSVSSHSKIPEIKKWSLQHISLIKLKDHPFQVSHNDINNNIINLSDYRGKIVLVDCWATWCNSCISGMKEIKKVYDKYQDRGFEVLSISMNSIDNRSEVLKVKEKIGFAWPLIIAGGKGYNDKESLSKKLLDMYGFRSVPQLLLIGKDGLLMEYNGPLFDIKRLEEILEKKL